MHHQSLNWSHPIPIDLLVFPYPHPLWPFQTLRLHRWNRSSQRSSTTNIHKQQAHPQRSIAISYFLLTFEQKEFASTLPTNFSIASRSDPLVWKDVFPDDCSPIDWECD